MSVHLHIFCIAFSGITCPAQVLIVAYTLTQTISPWKMHFNFFLYKYQLFRKESQCLLLFHDANYVFIEVWGNTISTHFRKFIIPNLIGVWNFLSIDYFIVYFFREFHFCTIDDLWYLLLCRVLVHATTQTSILALSLSEHSYSFSILNILTTKNLAIIFQGWNSFYNS